LTENQHFKLSTTFLQSRVDQAKIRISSPAAYKLLTASRLWHVYHMETSLEALHYFRSCTPWKVILKA